MAEVDNKNEERTSRFRLDNLGRKFGKTAAISTALFFFSLLGSILYTFTLPDNSWDSILPLILIGGPWAGMWISLFGYSIWSAWKLRGQPSDQVTDSMRRKRALMAFVVGVFAFLLPFAIVYGSPRGS